MSQIKTVIVNRGIRGPAGDQGPAGTPGTPGTPGTNGTNGSDATVTNSAVLSVLGVPTYVNLTAANASLTIGSPYYDSTLAKLQVTTA